MQTKNDNTPRFFVHPILDDLGLKPVPFRIYSHLLRRAGAQGHCKTKAETIAESCSLNRKTVFAAIATLERMELIKRSKKFAGCNCYLVPWPPKVPPKGMPAEEQTGHRSSRQMGQEGTAFKEDSTKQERASSAVTDSAPADCGTGPHSADPGNERVPPLEEARKMALEIREVESKADPYGNFALFPVEDYLRWTEDWLCKIEQDGLPRNLRAALKGYLRKASNRSARKFRELHESEPTNEDPPF